MNPNGRERSNPDRESTLGAEHRGMNGGWRVDRGVGGTATTVPPTSCVAYFGDAPNLDKSTLDRSGIEATSILASASCTAARSASDAEDC
jgi:hypothetical protein